MRKQGVLFVLKTNLLLFYYYYYLLFELHHFPLERRDLESLVHTKQGGEDRWRSVCSLRGQGRVPCGAVHPASRTSPGEVRAPRTPGPRAGACRSRQKGLAGFSGVTRGPHALERWRRRAGSARLRPAGSLDEAALLGRKGKKSP